MDSSKPSTNFEKQLLLEYYFMTEHKTVIHYRFCYVLKRLIKRSDNGSNVVIATTINSDTGSAQGKVNDFVFSKYFAENRLTVIYEPIY
jgi:hypothetical protein